MPQAEHDSGDQVRRDDRAINSLVFQMIVLMNAVTKPFNTKYGARYGIVLSEWRCVMWLAGNPGATGQSTARGTGMDRMSVSRNLRSLESKSFVTRREDPQDRKRWNWFLSPSGWDIYDGIIHSALDRDHVLTRDLSPEARRTISTFLASSLATLEAEDDG